MAYALLRFVHLLGAILLGAGLIGVWLSDLRSRQVRELHALSETIRNIAVFYDGVVVPGALLLLFSGTWMIVTSYGGWNFRYIPWLLGMVLLFAFELIEGNTVTRLYFMRLRRLSVGALKNGAMTPELEKARGEAVPTFTHFLDLPIFIVIVTLGALRPNDWALFGAGSVVAVVVAAMLTLYIPRLYPWSGAAEGMRGRT